MFVQHTLGYLLRMESKWWFWWWLLKQKTRWRNEAWSTDKLPTIPPFFLALKHHTKKKHDKEKLWSSMWECEWHKNHHQGKKISSRVLLSKSKLNKGKEKKSFTFSHHILPLLATFIFFCEMGSKCCHSMRNNKIPSSTHTFPTFTFQFFLFFTQRSHYPSSYVRKIVNFKHTTGLYRRLEYNEWRTATTKANTTQENFHFSVFPLDYV